VAWSAGVSAASAGLAALFVGAKAPLQRVVFVLFLIIAIVAFIILIGAGLQGALSWWRQRKLRAPQVTPVGPVRGQEVDCSTLGHPIRELAGPFAFGVHRAISADPADLPGLPKYVLRAHDERLRKIIGAASNASVMTVLVGDSSTGKSRAWWEAMCCLPSQWRVWAPANASELHRALTTGDISPRTVVWLDDAHNYLDPGLSKLAEDNASRLAQLIIDPSAAPILVAATLWPGNWQKMTAQPGERLPLRQAEGGDRMWQVAKLLAAATHINVPSSFQVSELTAVSAAARQDPRLAIALRQAPSGRIAQYLAGAQKVLERYETAPSETKALIDVAIDARRFGHSSHLPERLLLEAASGYIDDHTWDLLGDDWAAYALDAATLDWRGLEGPLTRIKLRPGEPMTGRCEYRLADVLEQAGGVLRRHITPPEEFWAAAAHNGSADDLTALADAAMNRCRYRNAAILYRKAVAAGDIRALSRLARMRERAGDYVEAERLAVKAANTGDTNALRELAEMREEAGDRTEAERLFRLASDAGDTVALWCLAEMLERAEEYVEAEQLYRLLVDAGDAAALGSVAEMREKAGDRVEAEQLATRAADAGDTWPLRSLAEMCEKAGDRAEAERLFRLASDAGDNRALSRLARMHEQAGERAEAERLFWLAAEGGDTMALRCLTEMRETAGDRAEAKQLATRAADGGDTWPLCALAEMCEKAGDRGEAEQLATIAADAGDISIHLGLAVIRERAGDYVGAEHLYRLAAEGGDTMAVWDRVRTLVEAGDSAAAEQLAVKAADIEDMAASGGPTVTHGEAINYFEEQELDQVMVDVGDRKTMRDRARIRQMIGDYAEARRLYQLIVDGGDMKTIYDLARLLEEAGNSPGAKHLLQFGLDANGNIARPWTFDDVEC
jgi:TPR repeat protein